MSGRQRPVVAPANGAKMLKVADVAEVLGVSQMTIRRLIERGELPGYRIAHAVRVRHDDLAEFMRAAVMHPGGDEPG